MKEQFTPGKWIAIGPKVQPDFKQTYFSIYSKSGKITKDAYECPGFFYPHSVQDAETMQANAKLIAAAPDMYAIIKGLIGEMDGEGGIKQNSEHIINARYLLEEIVK